MDLNHLTPEEIDFELLVRNTTGMRRKNLEWKLSRLQQLLDNEVNGAPEPSCSSYVMSDMDSIYHCQTKLSPILQALNTAFGQRKESQVISLKSRLLHYKFRISLISDPTILSNAKKSLEKVRNAVQHIDEFWQESTEDKDGKINP